MAQSHSQVQPRDGSPVAQGARTGQPPSAWAVCPPASECPIQGCAKCIGSGTLADSWDPSSGQGGCRAGAGFTPAGGLGALGGRYAQGRGGAGPHGQEQGEGKQVWAPPEVGRGHSDSSEDTCNAGQAVPPALPKGGCTPLPAQHKRMGETQGPCSTCPEAQRLGSPKPAPTCTGGCSPLLELPLQLGAGEGNEIPGLTAQQNPALAGAEEMR